MFEFRLPDVGEGVAEGEVVAWHVEVGDEVDEDEVLLEVETDKAVVDLPSPVAGTVAERHAAVGDVVPVGEVVITIDPADDADANVEAELEPDVESADVTTDDTDVGDESAGGGSAPVAAGRVFAPPSVRRLARERGVDLAAVEGSGPGGRVTAADVRAAGTGAADEDVADAITEVAPEADVEEVREPDRRSAIRRVEETDGEEAPAAGGDGATAPADRERTVATPATRRVAADLDVDIDRVPTDKTRDGEAFVDAVDVETFAETHEAAEQRPATTAEAATATEAETGVPEAGEGERAAGDRERREPYRGVRRTVGEHMAESAYTAPHVTHHDRAVVPALVEAREAMQSRAEAEGVRLTYVPFVLKAVVAGLREHPVLNSTLDEETEEIVYKEYYDVGVATATDAGLMVPVVRDVDEKGVLELAAEVNELVARARDRSIAREEMQGGTFTITNFGAVGGEYATPIVNYPETAILGLGGIEQRPVVEDGDVVARHTLPLSLSIDHRVIDGAEAARFANTVIEYLETPSLLLLE